MSAPLVTSVAPGSPAARAGIVPGDEVLRLNGQVPRDVIEWRMLVDEPELEIEVRRGGLLSTFEVAKRAGEPLGAEVESALFDQVRTCDNHCEFCFIYQLPPGMRKSLYLKDDDYRLSFLYGNFTTLTRFTEADLERVITERLSPLNVSIHATNPTVRAAMLRNRRGSTSLRWLRALLDHGIEVHGQVVVCPGLNDGAVLDDTMLGILDRFPTLATVGVVPLGVSDFNTEPEMRTHTPEEALAVVEAIEGWQEVFTAVLGHRLVFLGDEYHLMAGRPFPPLEAYEGCLQHENGIGMAATFSAEVRAALAGERVEGTGPRSGFFAWVDGAPAEGYRAPRVTGAFAVRDGRRTGAPVALLTGAYGRAVLAPLLLELSAHAGAPVRCLEVENRWFGGNIGVTGLMTGPDIARTLADVLPGERVLLPDVALSEDRFLDGSTVEDLPHPVEIVATTGVALVEALA